MSKNEEFNERLDTEFDHFLLDMKPYVLKNPSQTGKVRPTGFLHAIIVIVQASVALMAEGGLSCPE